MKRHPSLEAFSRDHNVGLILGRKLVQTSSLGQDCRRKAAQELLQYWKDELADHFFEEERLLIPLIPGIELRSRLSREHLAFSELVANLDEGHLDPDLLTRTGQLLADHIRWEERVLFPSIEQSALASQLEELGKQTEMVESRRSDSTWSPRRGELIKKRSQDGVHLLVADRLHSLAIERWETEGGLALMTRKSMDARNGQ
jgi:iron-sulfur cluster repair protein YtfE (RIC family)